MKLIMDVYPRQNYEIWNQTQEISRNPNKIQEQREIKKSKATKDGTLSQFGSN